MRYNTGNPVLPDGSSDPRDIHDNGGNMDLAANSTALSWTDRLGKSRFTYAGMESRFALDQASRAAAFQQFLKASGSQYLGVYASGLRITALNQTFSREGAVWRPLSDTVLPYTLTGNWATDSTRFMVLADNRLGTVIAISEYVPTKMDAPAQVSSLVDELSYSSRNVASLPGTGAWSISERFSIIKARMAAGEMVNICCFGDSTTDGQNTTGWTANTIGSNQNAAAPSAYPIILQGLLREMHSNNSISVWNAGFAGKKLSDGWAYSNYAAAVINNANYGTPDLCFIAFGLNDIAGAGSQITEHLRQTRMLCARMLAAGTVPVLLSCDPSYRVDGVRDPKESRRQLDALKSALALEMNIPFFDIGLAVKDWFSQNKDGHQWAIIQNDALHLSDLGHRFKAGYLAKQLFDDCVVYQGKETLIENWDSAANAYAGYAIRYAGSNTRQGGNLNASDQLPTNGQAVVTSWIWNPYPDCELLYLSLGRENMAPTMTVRPRAELLDTLKNISTSYTCGMVRIGNETNVLSASDVPHKIGFLPYGLSRVRYIAGNSSTFFFGCFGLIPGSRANAKKGNALATVGEMAITSAGTAFAANLLPYGPDGSQIASAQIGETLEFLIDVEWPVGHASAIPLITANAWGTGATGADLLFGSKVSTCLYRSAVGQISLSRITTRADGTLKDATKITTDYAGAASGSAQKLRVRITYGDTSITFALADSWYGADVYTQTLDATRIIPLSGGAVGGLIASSFGGAATFTTILRQLIWRKL